MDLISKASTVGGLIFLKIIHIIADNRSFIFNVDKLDKGETQGQLEAGTALVRELREVVVPEVDTNVYKIMADGAGHKPAAAALTKSNIDRRPPAQRDRPGRQTTHDQRRPAEPLHQPGRAPG